MCNLGINLYLLVNTTSYLFPSLFLVPSSCSVSCSVLRFNGEFHKFSGTDYDYDHSINFDLNEELVRAMPMPPFDDFNDKLVWCLGESRGHLCLVDFCEDLTTALDVYERDGKISLRLGCEVSSWSRWVRPTHLAKREQSICPISLVFVVKRRKRGSLISGRAFIQFYYWIWLWKR